MVRAIPAIEAPSGSNGDTAPLELPPSRPILRRIQERYQARQRSLVFRPGRAPMLDTTGSIINSLAVSARTVLLRFCAARENASTENFATASVVGTLRRTPLPGLFGRSLHRRFCPSEDPNVLSPAAGETVTYGCPCEDEINREWKRGVLVSTDKSLNFLTEDGTLVLSVTRAQDRKNDKYLLHLGGLENPDRYFAGDEPWGGHWRSPGSSSPLHSIFTNMTRPVVSSPTAPDCTPAPQLVRTPRPCSECLRR